MRTVHQMGEVIAVAKSHEIFKVVRIVAACWSSGV